MGKGFIRESALAQMPNGYTLRTPDYRYTRWKEGGPAYAELITELNKKLSQRVEAASRPPEGLVVR